MWACLRLHPFIHKKSLKHEFTCLRRYLHTAVPLNLTDCSVPLCSVCLKSPFALHCLPFLSCTRLSVISCRGTTLSHRQNLNLRFTIAFLGFFVKIFIHSACFFSFSLLFFIRADAFFYSGCCFFSFSLLFLFGLMLFYIKIIFLFEITQKK